MGRTTICRSERAALLAVAAVLVAGPVLRAQDTAAVAAAAPAAQLPATHTVVAGETLWGIAFQYYGDALLWPEIYRLNTAVVEDPHWIYPGELLMLAPAVAIAQGEPDTATVIAQGEPADTVRAPADTVIAADTMVMAPADTMLADTAQAAAVEPPPPPEPVAAQETMFDRVPTAGQRAQSALRAYTGQTYRPLRRGEFYAAGFLTEGEALPWARVVGTTNQPAIAQLERRTTVQQFEEVQLAPARDASYHVGDSLLVARLDRSILGWGNVVVPIGIVRVTEVQDGRILGSLVAQYGRVRRDHVAMPIEPFRDPGDVRPVPVAGGLQGQVIDLRDVQVLTGTQDYVFVDKGRADGVTPGDVFEVYRPQQTDPNAPTEAVYATLMIVHVRDRSATGLVIGVGRGDLHAGMPVRLIRKMPS
jgi:hypothetical protein